MDFLQQGSHSESEREDKSTMDTELSRGWEKFGHATLGYRSVWVHRDKAGEVWSGTSELRYRLCSLAGPLLPDEKESKENEFSVLDHLIGDIEVRVSRSFGFEKASAASGRTMAFDDDGFRVSVYKLEEVSEFNTEGGRTLTYNKFGSGTLGFPLVLDIIEGD